MAAKPIALVGGRLIDGFGGPPLANSVILLEGERIKAIGQVGSLAVPNDAEIIDALRRQGKDLKRLAPEDLHDFDQDHYGGLEAVEALGRRAGIDASSRVLDVCAGLAGAAVLIVTLRGFPLLAVAPRIEHDDTSGPKNI